MPIEFTVSPDLPYYTAKFIGTVTDGELTESYRLFSISGKWKPYMNELTDLSQATENLITKKGLFSMAMLTKSVVKKHGFSPRLAVYAPSDLKFGFSRMYLSMIGWLPNCRVFRDRESAVAWVSVRPD